MNSKDMIALFRLAQSNDEIIAFIAANSSPELATAFELALPAMEKVVWIADKMGLDLNCPTLSEEQCIQLEQEMGKDIDSLIAFQKHLEAANQMSEKVRKANQSEKARLLAKIDAQLKVLEENRISGVFDEAEAELLNIKKQLEAM